MRQIVQDCQSALDWTATAVKEKFYPASDWMPYYPLGKNEPTFQQILDQQVKRLRADQPKIAAAFERHQQYQPGKAELGYLKALRKINTHRDFTPQIRQETQATTWNHGGAGVTLSGGASITMSGNADILIGGKSIRQIASVRTTYVDWQFTDPQISVLPTLEALASHVRAAVEDIRSEARL